MESLGKALEPWLERMRSVVITDKATNETVTLVPTIRCRYEECDGSGIILLEGGWTGRECRCESERREAIRVQRLFTDLRIPKRYQAKTLDTFQPEWQSLGWRMAKRYVERFEELRNEGTNGLLFIGPPGTGKTHLVYAILHAILPLLPSAICASVPDLMDMLRPPAKAKDDERRTAEQTVRERMQALQTSGLLILDDLGAEKESVWVTERLYMIINYRYNEQLPTLLTSNLELKQLEQIPGWARIVSRIDEMCHAVLCDGEDRRKHKPQRKDDKQHEQT